MPKKLTKEEFIVKAKKVHGNKFNYDLVEYLNNKTKVKIVCPLHGEFLQKPNDHLSGYGCRKCQYEKTSKINKFTTEDFINNAIKIHGNRYIYSIVEYNGYENKVNIICNKHGKFKQSSHSHLSGAGCPSCKESRGEKRITEFLLKNNINYQKQVSFDGLIGDKSSLFFDFYLPEYEMMIEFDGIQHTKPIKFFGGMKKLLKQKEYDRKKIDFVVRNGYKLLKLTYNMFSYLEEALECELKNNKILC
jgi:very-short-patch-repair endonuclease